MPYTSYFQVRSEIEKLTIGFIWEAQPELAPPKLQNKNPVLKKLSEQRALGPFTYQQSKEYQLEIIAEYCWMAYQKSITSTGDMVVGRQKDLARQGLYEKVAELVREETRDPNRPGSPNLTFLDEGVQGNLLNQDKWAGPVNDAWLLGGIHRRAKFRLTSPRIMENLWDTKGFLIVTAREIIGLLCFGYKLHQIGPWQVFLLSDEDAERATSSTLTQYAAFVEKYSTIRAAEALSRKQALGRANVPIG